MRAHWRLYAGASGAPHSDSDPDFVAGEVGGDSDSDWNAAESDDEDNHAGRHPRYSIPMGAHLGAPFGSISRAAGHDVALCSLGTVGTLSFAGLTAKHKRLDEVWLAVS